MSSMTVPSASSRPPRLPERLLAALTAQPWMTCADLAAWTGHHPGKVRAAVHRLLDEGRLVRRQPRRPRADDLVDPLGHAVDHQRPAVARQRPVPGGEVGEDHHVRQRRLVVQTEEDDPLGRGRALGTLDLLAATLDPQAPLVVRIEPAVEVLRQVWVQPDFGPEAPVPWRTTGDVPPADRLIHSPYDVET